MDKETIINRIRALRAKASNEASTEAEAMEAASLAAKLLQKYEITEADLAQVKNSDLLKKGFEDGRKQLHPVLALVWLGITKLTETRGWNQGGTLTFAGLPSDVEMALYLTEMLQGAAERSYNQYKRGVCFHNRRDANQHRLGFYRGFGNRVNDRLSTLSKERSQARTTGTSLVVKKSELIDTFLKEEGMTLRKRRAKNRYVNSDAEAAGSRAGSKVNLGRPVEGGASSYGRLS